MATDNTTQPTRLADRMYPTTVQPEAPATEGGGLMASETTTPRSGTPAAEERKLSFDERMASLKDKLYTPEVALQPAAAQHERTLSEVVAMTAAEQTAYWSTTAAMGRRTGLSSYGVLRTIVDAEVAALAADASQPPPDEEAMTNQIVAWNREIRRAVRDQYGAAGEKLIADTEKFIAADPELDERLARRAIGRQPELFLEILEFVRKRNR